jgi:hypothetical protein
VSGRYGRGVRRSQARALLGVESDDPTVVRAAYRRRMLSAHPDRNAAADATDVTIELTAAYRLLLQPAGTEPAGPAPTGRRSARPAPPPPKPVPKLRADAVDSGTIAVHASREETLQGVIEAAHRLGEIAYLDPQVGLVEAIVEFVEAPTSSVVMTLQGRATGVTDVFCTVEPLSGGESPPEAAVTRLVAATLSEIPLSMLTA